MITQPLINITRIHALLFAGFLVLYEFLTYIANDMIMPGMLEVIKDFNAPKTAVASSLTAYLLGGASLQLFIGPISDRYGRRPIMLFGAAFFFTCTVIIAKSVSIDQFLLMRFLQGMGLCFISVIGYATLQEIFDEMDAIRLIAIMANISILAPLLGPLSGSVFIYYYGWRLIFVVIAIFALLDLIGLWYFMPESIGQIKKDGQLIDRVSLAPKVVMRNYLKLMKNKPFLSGSLAAGFLMISCMIWIALSPVLLIQKAGLSVLEYGFWQIPIFGSAIIGNVMLQFLTFRYSITRIIWQGTFVVKFGLLLILILPFFYKGFAALIPGMIIYFFGLGILSGPLYRWILFSTNVAKGTTSALMTIIGMILQAIGIEAASHMHIDLSYKTFGIFSFSSGLIFLFLLCIAKQTKS